MRIGNRRSGGRNALASSLHVRADHGCQEEELHQEVQLLLQAHGQDAEVGRAAHVEEVVDEEGFDEEVVDEALGQEVIQRKPNVARALACSAVGSPVSSRTT